MKEKLIFVLMAALLIFVLGLQTSFSQEEKKIEPDAGKIIAKLDEILANQAETLKQFEAIKQELAVIKVRATRR